ncbi:uncharacterized protein LOC109835191 [Asparagus officinalis]|uniref:uncharacterized protein LOC109835191 n=1 Tax=Asparagus officinalis TaxID=4686 RepID=UPI00098E60F0|nr:uncharacterized protein LOC109835191 [Asparagus officinalis]
MALGNNEKKYNLILKMIDPIFKKNLSGTLHKVGYFLNPYFYYPTYIEIDGDESFKKDMVECIHRLYPDDHATFTKIGDQIPNYQERLGSFGDQYGNDTPELRKMPIKILGLTTSSSTCERNWITFEMIHMKKMNRLTNKKLHDLVFVKFNAILKNKHAFGDRDSLSAYDDEERVSEWLLGKEGNDSDDEVFPGGCLTFRQVRDVSEDNPRKRKSGRLQRYKGRKKSGSSSSKGEELVEDDEEDEINAICMESDEEDNPTFNSNED